MRGGLTRIVTRPRHAAICPHHRTMRASGQFQNNGRGWMGNGEYPHIKWLIFTLLYNSSRARASQGLCLIASKNINPASDYSGKCPETRDWTQQPVHIEHESHFCSRESHGPLRLGCVWEGDNDGYILVLYWVLCPAMSLYNFHGSVHRNRWILYFKFLQHWYSDLTNTY